MPTSSSSSAATARGAPYPYGLVYRPSVRVPRDVGCRALAVYVANLFSVQFSSVQFRDVFHTPNLTPANWPQYNVFPLSSSVLVPPELLLPMCLLRLGVHNPVLLLSVRLLSRRVHLLSLQDNVAVRRWPLYHVVLDDESDTRFRRRQRRLKLRQLVTCLVQLSRHPSQLPLKRFLPLRIANRQHFSRGHVVEVLCLIAGPAPRWLLRSSTRPATTSRRDGRTTLEG